MSYLTANMKMIAECADKLVQLGEKLFNETKMETTKAEREYCYLCPTGYEFRDENGNVIETEKIFLGKKKSKYPRTINECRDILEDATGDEVGWYAIDGWQFDLLEEMQKLLICRDAYWELAGDWKPDLLDDNQLKFFIANWGNSIKKRENFTNRNYILIFPTEEMRDAFYENFKDLIEECKELL